MTLAAAKVLGASASYGVHSAIYYAVFVLFTLWALLRGAAKAGGELAIVGAISMLAIPAASLIGGRDLYDAAALLMVDLVAGLLALGLVGIALSARRRARSGATDSVWSAPAQAA